VGVAVIEVGGNEEHPGGMQIDMLSVLVTMASEIVNMMTVSTELRIGLEELSVTVIEISTVVVNVMSSFRNNTAAVGTDSDESGIVVTRFFLEGTVLMYRGS
jgi:hypothetical protein